MQSSLEQPAAPAAAVPLEPPAAPRTSTGIPTTREPSQPPEVIAKEGAPDPASSLAMQQFKPFGLTHGVTLALCIGLITALVIMGRRLRPAVGRAPGSRHQVEQRGVIHIDPAGQLLGVVGLLLWLSWQLWWAMPSRFDAAQGLPLHVCDLAGLIAAIAMLSGSRFFTTILVFWGLGLCTQAYFTPVVDVGPLFTEYWIFWESHTLIIGSAVYVIAVRGYRPSTRDLRTIVLFSLAYLAVMLPLDILTGWNYGYVGKTKPTNPTPIDLLGPWPFRLIPMVLIANALFVIVWLPFRLGERRKRPD